MQAKQLAIGAFGGTIAMRAGDSDEGVVPSTRAQDLVAAVPQLAEVAEIRARTICNHPSASVRLGDVLDGLAFARAQVDAGADGVVFTHGTDMLEETAYLLDLMWDRPQPLVVTGAMRSLDHLGADGANNLLGAALTAVSAQSRGLGVLVTFDDRVHLARHVSKVDSMSIGSFQSPGWGPIGRIIEQSSLHYAFRPTRRRPDPLPEPDRQRPIRVAVVESPFDDDGALFELIAEAGYQALVIAAGGMGHLSTRAADVVEAVLAGGLPVVVATRTGSGLTGTHTYGYVGSETDLMGRGAIMAGPLSARKSRLLLHLLLCRGDDLGGIRSGFTTWTA